MVQALKWAGVRTAHHHASHGRLIWPVEEPARSARVDAIIVPTARTVASLQQAADAARRLNCPLVTLHSRRSSADKAARSVDDRTDLIAIDVPTSARLRLPELKTSQLLAGTVFERQTDVSTKRNLGLLLSHALRWKRVVFLDDDIRVRNPGDLGKAASLLDSHNAVGFRIGGFPDNSMVCHAFREAGGKQDTFIGGGALAIEVKRNRTFFPSLYNEDWFFILDARKRLQSVARTGCVIQDPYDPYLVERAQAEEFGDVLAEGTFWLLDQGKPVSAGDLAHWEDFLVRRKKFIEQVLGMVKRSTTIERARAARMTEALNASLDRLKLISPDLCMDYLEALACDQEEWQRHIQAIRQQRKLPLEAAIESLTCEGTTALNYRIRKATSSNSSVSTGHRSLVTRVPKLPRAQLSNPKAAMLSQPYVRKFVKRMKPQCSGSAFPTPYAPRVPELALVGQESKAKGDDYGENRPGEQVDVRAALSVRSG